MDAHRCELDSRDCNHISVYLILSYLVLSCLIDIIPVYDQGGKQVVANGTMEIAAALRELPKLSRRAIRTLSKHVAYRAETEDAGLSAVIIVVVISSIFISKRKKRNKTE